MKHDYPKELEGRMTDKIWPNNQGIPAEPRKRDQHAPLISIIVPSYNQAQFLEATLLSIIHQQYANLELIVLDGGSTDGSVDIIRRYEKWISHWESGKDGGQVSALNKGFVMSSGAILAWVNSDDILLPGALESVSNVLTTGNLPKVIVGKSLQIDEHGIPYYAVCGLPPTVGSLLFESCAGYDQPAVFWNRAAAEATGRLNPDFPLAFDRDFFLRLASKAKFRRLDSYLAGFRHHPASITETLLSRRLEEDYRLRCLLHGLDRYPAWYRTAMKIYHRGRYFANAGAFKARVIAGLETPPIPLARRRPKF